MRPDAHPAMLTVSRGPSGPGEAGGVRLRRHSTVDVPAPRSSGAPERFVVRPAGDHHDLHCAMCRTVVAYGVGAELSSADVAFYGELHACSSVARRGSSPVV